MTVDGQTLSVIIPAFHAAKTIEPVIKSIPGYVDWIIVVDDASPDHLKKVLSSMNDSRLIVLSHDTNQGVGGAMITGYQKALELNSDLIAKIDADGQMDPKHLYAFAKTAILHQCDYIKANRFGHIKELQTMPKIRFAGSLILTFMTKFVSGCWNVFDPQNGYTMITCNILKRLDLNRLDKGYFFENSMLINLNIIKARIGEIYLPALYGQEISSMKIWKIISTFPLKLVKGFIFRVYHKYIFRSLSPVALLMIFGLICIIWGCIWGTMAWYRSIITGIPATTGTVILALLPLLLGWSSLLQSLVLDVQDAGPSFLFDFDDETLLLPSAGRIEKR